MRPSRLVARSKLMHKKISPEMMSSLVEYDPGTGAFFWKHREPRLFRSEAACNAWNNANASKPAFSVNNGRGYTAGYIFGRKYFSHHVAWAIVFGEWPGQIDHVNGDRADNRIANLRAVSSAENNRNRKTPNTNRSGQIGVFYDHRRSRWVARIHFDGKRTFLGHFQRKCDAILARKKAESKLGYHPNHGRAA